MLFLPLRMEREQACAHAKSPSLIRKSAQTCYQAAPDLRNLCDGDILTELQNLSPVSLPSYQFTSHSAHSYRLVTLAVGGVTSAVAASATAPFSMNDLVSVTLCAPVN